MGIRCIFIAAASIIERMSAIKNEASGSRSEIWHTTERISQASIIEVVFYSDHVESGTTARVYLFPFLSYMRPSILLQLSRRSFLSPRYSSRYTSSLNPKYTRKMSSVSQAVLASKAVLSSIDLSKYDAEQSRLMDERCILVDEQDRASGAADKKTCMS